MFTKALKITTTIAQFIFILSFSLTSQAKGGGKGDKGQLGANEIRVMTYNIENLFDAEHDQDKDDWDFLPQNYPGKKAGCARKSSRYRSSCLASDWTQEKLNVKLGQIKKMLLSRGALPDILAVQEIENANVLKQLADTLGYDNFVLEEGPDNRGIDTALLYNSNKVQYINHSTKTLAGPEFTDRATRDILAVYFDFPKSKNSENVLAIYVNHWPSQAAPSIKRYAAAQQLKRFMNQDRKRYGSSYHGVVLGDFNTIHADWPHPLKGVLENPAWDQHLLDTQSLAKKFRYYKRDQPLGSYYYPPEMKWSFLDHIYITQNLNDSKGIEAVIKSFKVVNPSFAKKTFTYNRANQFLFTSVVAGVPVRYNHRALTAAEAGYSDHFPVEITLRYR